LRSAIALGVSDACPWSSNDTGSPSPRKRKKLNARTKARVRNACAILEKRYLRVLTLACPAFW